MMGVCEKIAARGIGDIKMEIRFRVEIRVRPRVGKGI